MKLKFQVSVETDEATGDVLAVYFQFRSGNVADTREFANGKVFADYSKQGELLGVEMLAPCKVSIMDRIAREETTAVRRQAKQFLRQSGPRQMVCV